MEKVYNSIFDLFKDELGKGNKVSVTCVGTFKISERVAREGRNPQLVKQLKLLFAKV